MLKKIAKRINKEIEQAQDYTEQAFLVKHKSSETSELFAQLAHEEIDHAKKLLKEGQRLVDRKSVPSYDKTAKTEVDEHWHEKCKAIWEWETRLAMETISEIEYKLNLYRDM